MELVLRDHEIAVCMDVLDFYARIFIGQYDEIDDVLSQNLCWSCGIETNRFERTLLYTAMRSLEIPELKGWELNGSLGIWNEVTDIRAKNAYDMKQLIRYHDAWAQQSSGSRGRQIEKPAFYGKMPEMDCQCRITNTGAEIMKLVLDLAEIVEKLYDVEAPEDDPSSMERLEQIRTFVGRIAGEDVVEDSCYPGCFDLTDSSLISCGASFVQSLHA